MSDRNQILVEHRAGRIRVVSQYALVFDDDVNTSFVDSVDLQRAAEVRTSSIDASSRSTLRVSKSSVCKDHSDATNFDYLKRAGSR